MFTSKGPAKGEFQHYPWDASPLKTTAQHKIKDFQHEAGETSVLWYGGLHKLGVPQIGWLIMENPIWMNDLGVPLFEENPKWFCLKMMYTPNKNTRS